MKPALLYRDHPAGPRLEDLALDLVTLSPGQSRELALNVAFVLFSIFERVPCRAQLLLLLMDSLLLAGQLAADQEARWRPLRRAVDTIGSSLYFRMLRHSDSAQRAPEHPSYVMAETLRRACEDDVSLVLPLLVQDARELLVWARVDTAPVDRLVE
jgi:hypothetical protein